MSLPAKWQKEETGAVVGKVLEGSGGGTGKQQHVGVGSSMIAESASAYGGTGELRPAKVARHGDRGVEAGEKAELVNNGSYANFKPGRDVGCSGSFEGAVADGNNLQEVQVQTMNTAVKILGSGSVEGKSDREGWDPMGMGLERKASEEKECMDAFKECSSSKELLGRVNVKGGERGESVGEAGQELLDNTCRDGNFDGLSKKCPREGEGKVAMTEGPTDVKWEEQHEKAKEKEKKDEKRSEGKEDVLPSLQLMQAHLDVNSEKDNEKDEKEKEKERGDKEKERARQRERSRDKEKEAVRSEKREKREKERDRDSHRREREQRDGILVVKGEKGEGKGVGVDNMDVDRKPVREVDERKLVEKEDHERVRDRDRDKEGDEAGEGDKRKKRGREQENDRDSLSNIGTEGAGGDKEKNADHGQGVHQRKRMLRPRAQSNPANRDPRSRFRPEDSEGTQGRPESLFINYRPGEGIPELAKFRKEYESGERISSANGSGPTVEIRIPAEYATTNNRQIRGSQLWGTDIYTDDSDIVAVLLHTGYYSSSPVLPPNSTLELRATIRILESQNMYISTLRNGLRSRAWGGGSGCSYTVERCRIMKVSSRLLVWLRIVQQGGFTVELKPCLTRTPPIAPTLAPAASERTVTTRAASSNAYRQQRFMQEVTIQYNLCNEPWAKYCMNNVADRGLKKSQYTSARLKKGEVLYVETLVHRYELAYDGERATCNGAATATSLPQDNSGMEKGKEKWGAAERASAVVEKEPILRTHSVEKSHGNHPTNGYHGNHNGPGRRFDMGRSSVVSNKCVDSRSRICSQ
nr:myb-like protein X isoform X3 [Physcomitrium patens]XP_024369247.1 myb-like protein X isoform X3 [Physcomitrium patens]XP_024369248.1 myb-like protein X isoform X3 [Physcomitrium patens]|eukprot:XP_024369246.1 myb-like protein X isoform X3 [Physcomitrella patens]